MLKLKNVRDRFRLSYGASQNACRISFQKIEKLKWTAGALACVLPHIFRNFRCLFAVTILLLACGLAAAYLPARTASRVDLMQALRGD